MLKLHEEVIDVPNGVFSYQKLRMEGKGHKGKGGGKPGDLYIRLDIEPDHYYDNSSGEIVSECWLNPTDSIFGTTTTISTLSGDYTIKVSPGTKDGETIKLAHCGISKGKTQKRRGIHVLRFRVKIPEAPNEELKELYKRLQEMN